MIGMILSNYHLEIKDELILPLKEYERDENISPSNLLEGLLEKFLYDKGYIHVEEGIIQTPFEIHNERKNRFTCRKKGEYTKLVYDDTIDLGSFKTNEIDGVIDKLLDFSDREIEELDKGKWKYPQHRYKEFIYGKLDNPLLTVEEFMENKRILKRKDRESIVFSFYKIKDVIARFSTVSFSNKTIDKVFMFLKKLDDGEIIFLKDSVVNSTLPSSEVVMDYMKRYPKNKRRPHTVPTRNGKLLVQKSGFTFGTHENDKVDEVLDFLEANNWDKKYSTKCTGLGRDKYREWLYSEMEKAKKV